MHVWGCWKSSLNVRICEWSQLVLITEASLYSTQLTSPCDDISDNLPSKRTRLERDVLSDCCWWLTGCWLLRWPPHSSRSVAATNWPQRITKTTAATTTETETLLTYDVLVDGKRCAMSGPHSNVPTRCEQNAAYAWAPMWAMWKYDYCIRIRMLSIQWGSSSHLIGCVVSFVAHLLLHGEPIAQ